MLWFVGAALFAIAAVIENHHDDTGMKVLWSACAVAAALWGVARLARR